MLPFHCFPVAVSIGNCSGTGNIRCVRPRIVPSLISSRWGGFDDKPMEKIDPLSHLPCNVPAALFLLPLTFFLYGFKLAGRDEFPRHHMNFLLVSGRIGLIRNNEIFMVRQCGKNKIGYCFMKRFSGCRPPRFCDSHTGTCNTQNNKLIVTVRLTGEEQRGGWIPRGCGARSSRRIRCILT